MVGDFSEAGAQVASLALKIGAATADAFTFMASLGEELPVVEPVLKTLKTVREKVARVKSNREEMAALQERCTYITACFIVKCRRNPSSEMDVRPVERCLDAALEFVDRCSRRGKVWRALRASSVKDEIAGLNASVDRLTAGLGLVGIAVLEGKADNMKAMLQAVLTHLQKMPAKQAAVPKGTPARKSWHVERRGVMDTVFKALTGGTGPKLAGLVGHSGSGKTTVASEIIRSTEVREAFSDGVVWLTVNDDAKDRLSSVMLQLARMVFEDIGGSVGSAPSGLDDGAAYVRQQMTGGPGEKRLKCLVVADNVWEDEVVSKLMETGMWVLLSTRDEALVTDADGKAVRVDELSTADAESVLRRAAELAPEVRLPDDAVDLIELCGRVAMDVAFVGRWSTVRGRQDRTAWAAAAEKVRAEMTEVGGESENEAADDVRSRRRKAILRAGFEDLAIGSDDQRVPRLYLSLAVLPHGHEFTVNDAAVLLYDRAPSDEDKASAKGVVDILERWSVLRSNNLPWSGSVYHMHDAHSGFARERLTDRGDVRRPAVKRWIEHISSLDTLRFMSWSLRQYWRAVEEVGGDSWESSRPYAAALARMDDSDPLLWESMEAVATFQQDMEDLEGASTTYCRMFEVITAKIERQDVDSLFSLFSPYSLHQLGEYARESGRLEEAEGLLRRCLGIKEAKLGPEDVRVAYTLHQLGVCVREAGRLAEAEGLLRRCLGIKEMHTNGSDDVQVAYTVHELGVCVRRAGQLEEAEELLRRCLGIKEAKLGPEHAEVAYTLLSLGICLQKAGRMEEAEDLLRRCFGIRESKLSPKDLLVADVLHQLGIVVRETGRPREAEELFRRCLAIQEADGRVGRFNVPMVDTLRELDLCLGEVERLVEGEGSLDAAS